MKSAFVMAETAAEGIGCSTGTRKANPENWMAASTTIDENATSQTWQRSAAERLRHRYVANHAALVQTVEAINSTTIAL